ncbi:unnamed protein product, partial [Mesorhabditis belari]|uniref:Uncharacterized protein n=1 Tax=Mesorhabditis belari TaxID=2138241 RepID=A0AAF3EJ12_9BILA
MRMAVTTAASTSSDISGLADQLVQKEIDYNELQALFTKYKLKQKVKYDKLRDEVLAYIKKTATSSDKENNALLMIRVSETEAKLEEAERRNEALNRELQRRQTQINDQTILLKNLEDQVRARRPMTEMERSERRRMNELVDMESVHAQMTYKDERIIELNNVILDKERQILDLQELVREHDEVASSKKQAMRLVQKRFEELDSKTHRTIGTETDFSLLNGSPSHARSRHEGASTSFSRAIRGTSPGRAVRGHQQSHGTSSPPPLDPSEDTLDDEDQPGTSNLVRRLMEEKRKKKLRVTFDLPASGSLESILHPPSEKRKEEEKIEAIEKAVDPVNHEERQREIDEFASAVQALTTENERLRGVVDEQSTELVELRANASEADNEASRVQKENKSATAKARVVAQARIKDLEDKMAELNKSLSTQIESLQMENETLRSTREWEIEENAKMRQRLAKTLEKNNKLHGEVEASLVTNCELETRMLAEQEVMQRMMEDLEDAERIIVQQDDDKAQMAEDMELMRGAIIAQEQFIEVLEADIVIYEEHIGILRESLGASKVDHRDLIRSKAFEAKLRALEEEKQEIARTRHA